MATLLLTTFSSTIFSLISARWLVPEMVKNSVYSSFVCWRLIWACFSEQLLAPRQDVNSWVPANLKESRVFP
jgi:hypothetical protein